MKASQPGKEPERADAREQQDTLVRGLSREERQRLDTDAWEPSLLRRMLRAQGTRERTKKGE